MPPPDFAVEQVTSTKRLQHVMSSKQSVSLITQRNRGIGEDPPRTTPTWGLK